MILEMLQDNSRIPLVDISKRTGRRESTIRRRVQGLVDRGIIKRFTIEIGEAGTTRAIVLVSIDSAVDTHLVSTKLIGVPGVKIVYEVTGQYDITAVIGGSNISEINDTIDSVRKIRGVTDTNSVIILRTYT